MVAKAGVKVYWSSSELQERYGVCLRTIQSWEKKKGFPKGSFFSKEYRWSIARVIAWEKVHMRHLHDTPDVTDEAPEQTIRWSKIRGERAEDRERKLVKEMRLVAKPKGRK